MAWDLCVNWETEIMRARLIAKLGVEKASALEPAYLKEWPLTIPIGVDYSCIGDSSIKRAKAARSFTGPAATEGLGSNNWVLAGARTASEKPLLANDMHLGMGTPSLWYENHLIAGDFNASGLSFAGIPGIVQGHNARVAWGFTNGFSDVQDLYIEHLRENDHGITQYEYQGKWYDAEILNEVIQVKGQKPVTERVTLTRHGPIINSLAPDLSGEAPLALCWVTLREDSSVNALFNMNAARNCEEFRDAMLEWITPNQNAVYADIEGNTGYSLPGLVPMRAKGDGRIPVPGWTGEYEWTGYIPFQELPHMFNPARGFIATANNKVVDDAYPYWLGVDVGAGNRCRRIEELIESKKTHTVEDIGTMQTDQVSIAARITGRILAGMVTANEEMRPILLRFAEWDGHLAATSPEAAIYEVFIDCLMNRLLKPVLGDFTEHYRGKGPTPVIKLSSMLGDHSRMWLLEILQDQNSPWWESPGGKSREDHLSAALVEAIDTLKRTCGPNIEDWQWGKIHKITFNHALGSVKPLDKMLNRGPYPLGGDIDTLWMGNATLYDLSCASIVGPQFRFIGDLSNWNNSRGVIVPGQSGHPASKHYDDGIKGWFHGTYHPMLFDRELILESVAAKLILSP
jgi:penicillin amidase